MATSRDIAESALHEVVGHLASATNSDVRFRVRVVSWIKVGVMSLVSLAASAIDDSDDVTEPEPNTIGFIRNGYSKKIDEADSVKV